MVDALKSKRQELLGAIAKGILVIYIAGYVYMYIFSNTSYTDHASHLASEPTLM